jgi:hypothetical protein
MDPYTRLTLFLWQFARRRHSRTELVFYTAVLIICLVIGLLDWAEYWPEHWKTERGGMPKVHRL